MFEAVLERWDGDHVVVRHHPGGAWIFVGIHSTRLGPAAGGTRLKQYESAAAGLEDCLRLARGMTRKLAVLGLPHGGGKAVIAVTEIPAGDERRRLFEWYADLLNSLGGSFITGPDVNTGEADMDVIGERSRHVFCTSLARGGSGDPSIHTAYGVFHGIRASLRHAFGSEDLGRRSVLVQGTGSVGAKLVQLLAEAGATVLATDIDEERARATGASVVPAAAALTTECDVYAPCALGATLNADSIPGLRCRVVAGAANNQLATEADGERLRAAGILYAPDYVINGGGALHGIGLEQLGWSPDELEAQVEAIGETLAQIYASADAHAISTEAAAERLAAERLAALDSRPTEAQRTVTRA